MDEHGWATRSDIVDANLYGGGMGLGVADHYPPDQLHNYGHDVVSDGGYWAAAAAWRAGRFKVDIDQPREGESNTFEVKVPSVPKERILGFVATPEAAVKLKAAGVPADKILESPMAMRGGMQLVTSTGAPKPEGRDVMRRYRQWQHSTVSKAATGRDQGAPAKLYGKVTAFLASLKTAVEKVGNERSGHRGHQGRPGIRGGSLPRGGAPAVAVSTPAVPARETLVLTPTENPSPDEPPVDESGRRRVIADEDFQSIRENIERMRPEGNATITPVAQKAMERALQEFARDAEDRLGPAAHWKVEGYQYDYDGWRYDATGTWDNVEGQARMTIDFTPDRASGAVQPVDVNKPTIYNDYMLHAAYVKMPEGAQRRGMGQEIVKNVMHTAREGGFKSVVYDAVSNGSTLKGGFVWAKMGATFAKPIDRERMVQSYLHYTGRYETYPESERMTMFKTWEPRDILNAPGGDKFLLSSDSYYSGKFDVR
jgi:hypothetical protein